MAEPEAWQLVLTELVLGEAGEQVAQCVRADRPDAARRHLQAGLGLLDQPGLGELARQLGQALQGAGGVVAEQVAHAIHVGLGERRRRRHAAQQPLELVELAELGHRLHRLGQSERVVAVEVVRRVPALRRGRAPAGCPRDVHLPLQVDVAEELLGQLLELGPLLGRHRVEHRLHRRHPLGERLEQLVEGLGFSGKKSP